VRYGLVDVPGHERFVKNMVAGATGIDVVLLVIAADEGVMPQTREHLEICQLLGVKSGLVALTKVDMVDDDWLEMVTEDIKDYLAGTFLEGAPIVPFSSMDGTGRNELLEILESLSGSIQARTGKGIFRLPVDRVFSMKGFGTVVTGTLISGKVTSGDDVIFLPGDKMAKLRGMQVHGETVDGSSAGTRTALNLQGIDKGDIHRGQTAAIPGTLEPTLMIDAVFDLLPSAPRPLKNRERIRLHLFTAEVMARVVVLEGDVIEPGGAGKVQLRLEEPAVTLPGDRFVVRSYSPMMTIGGGAVLDPLPKKHKRDRQPVIDQLEALVTEDPGERVAVYLAEAGDHGLRADRLAVRSGVTVEEVLIVLEKMASEGLVVRAGDGPQTLVYSAGSFETLKGRLLKALSRFHEANPAREGLGREELRMRVARELPDRPYRNLLAALTELGEINVEGDVVKLADHSARLTTDQEKLAARILGKIKGSSVSVPMVPELTEEMSVDPKQLKEVLNLLGHRGDLVRIKDDYYLPPDAHESMMAGVESFFADNGEMAMADFREIVDTTRKWMIPLLEYLDRTQVTMRKGDIRIKRGKAPSGG
jgi:selenocysteine-specific elongation factor